MHKWNYFIQHFEGALNEDISWIFQLECKNEMLQWFICEEVTREQKEALLDMLLNND
jgi:hypothetical protein